MVTQELLDDRPPGVYDLLAERRRGVIGAPIRLMPQLQAAWGKRTTIVRYSRLHVTLRGWVWQ
jgi:hypothetical protein